MSTTLLAQEWSASELTPSVGFCASGASLLDRVSAALKAGGLSVSHPCNDLAAALEACAKHDLDLIVIGAKRSDPATLGVIRSLSQAFPRVRLVIVCERSAAGDIRKALDAGAKGFVLVDEVDEVLELVLRVVFAGQVSVPGLSGQEVGKRVLTTREKQILGFVVRGLTNAEIASRLYLAESTVKSHLSSSFAKLGVASRNEAAAFVLDPMRGRELGIALNMIEETTPSG